VTSATESRKRPFVVALFVAVIGGLIVEWAKDFPFLHSAGAAVTRAVSWVGQSVLIRRWQLGALLLITAAVIGGTIWLLMRRLYHEDWTDYRSDVFLGIKWRWSFAFGDVINLVPYCTKCDFEMRFYNAAVFAAVPRTGLQCDDCGHQLLIEGNSAALLERVEKLIHRNVRARKQNVLSPGSAP
jgi:hypothetical protein